MTTTEVGAPRAADPLAPADAAPSAFRRALLGMLAGALLASTVVLGWLAVGRAGDGTDVQAERETVMSRAEQFLLRVNSYGPDLLDDSGQMPEYRSGVRELISAKLATSFDQSVTIAEQLVEQAGVKRSAQVFATGVSTIDADSARVIVAGEIDQSYETRQGGEPVTQESPFRIEVSLVKVDGSWLVDDYDPVGGAEQ